jgi:hypothetical protein
MGLSRLGITLLRLVTRGWWELLPMQSDSRNKVKPVNHFFTGIADSSLGRRRNIPLA